MTEAAEAALHWARTNYPEGLVVAYVEPENFASSALAQHLGLERGESSRDGADVHTLGVATPHPGA